MSLLLLLLVVIIILIFKSRSKKDIIKQDIHKKNNIVIYLFILFVLLAVTILILYVSSLVTDTDTYTDTNLTTSSESESESEPIQSEDSLETYIKSSSEIEEENFKKGTLADEIKEELTQLEHGVDEMSDTLFAHNTFVPNVNNSYQLNPYLGVKGLYDASGISDFNLAWSKVHIYGFVRFSYTSDDWLFARYIEIKTDNNKYSIEPDYSDWNRDNSSGEIWEWYDAPLTPSTAEMYNDIASSSDTLVRLHGDTYHDDRYLTDDERSALKEILSIYNKYLDLNLLIK